MSSYVRPFVFRGKEIPRKGDQRRLRFQTDGASDACPCDTAACTDCIPCEFCGRNIQEAVHEAHYYWCRSTARHPSSTSTVAPPAAAD